MGHIKAEVSTTYHIPPSEEFFIHVLLDFLRHFLLVGAIFDCVIDDMLGFELDFWLHFRVGYLYTPLLSPLVHIDQL